MRNLKSIRHAAARFDALELPNTATTWDIVNDSLICAFGPSPASASIELRRISCSITAENELGNIIASWDAPCPSPNLGYDRVVSLQHFAESLTTCLVLAGGDIVAVREEPLPGQDHVEIVGSVDVGIAAAGWSPEEELLAIVTNANTIIYMTKYFESTVTVAFTNDDHRISKHVSVGWGKTETQFKGKRAKALKDPTMPEHVDEGKLSALDDGRIHVSWRGDGAYLAVSSIEDGRRRMIRVYSREGILDSVSEPVDHLEGCIAWRPAGNVIAGIKRGNSHCEVVFFERNGLRHGEFDLRLDKDGATMPITSLRWNIDSSVLAVGFPDSIQLWTMGNYHYYLKQQLFHDYPPSDPRSAPESHGLDVKWHPEQPLRVAVSTEGYVQQIDYVSSTCTSSTTPPVDLGGVAVIDGQTLKVTALRRANVPPPQAQYEVSLTDPILDVAFNGTGAYMAALSAQSLTILSCTWDREPNILRKIDLKSILQPGHVVRQVVLLGDNHPVVLVHNTDLHCDQILLQDHAQLIDLDNGSVTSLISTTARDKVLIVTTKNAMYEVDGSGRLEKCAMSLPSTVVHCEIASIGKELTAFGLTSNGTLFANERVLARNCTSIAVTPAHLIFSTGNSLLKFVHLSSDQDLDIPADSPETDERCREIESGGRIVTVVPSTYAIVLQMPRGNLETIFPRALVLASIRQNIAECRWLEAFLTCRAQRVDMNILHDQNPELFMQDVANVVRQLKKAEYIDLFLSSLRDEDVTQSMYKDTLKGSLDQIHTNIPNALGTELPQGAANGGVGPAGSAASTKSSKVNSVCDKFLAYLTSRARPGTKALRNIITAHVCKQPPDLEAGLQVISSLQELDAESEQAERAAEHICFLADVNTLYSAALGLYNIKLTLLIAQQSQKDPREYLPYLQALLDMSEQRRKFTIDHDLRLHAKALARLHELGPEALPEFKAYAQRHELYRQAIDFARYDHGLSNELTKMYADFLVRRNSYAEAGVVYEYLEAYEDAAEAYRQAEMWSEALSVAALAEAKGSKITSLESLAEDLAHACEETKKYTAAATIYRDYLAKPETAIKLYCKAHAISEAMRLVSLHRKPEWMTSIVDPGVIEATASMTEMLGEMREQLRKQVPRLQELRVKKQRDPLAFYDGGAGVAGDGADIPDNISLAPTDASTTGGTFMTRYTGRTDGTLNTQATRKTHKNRRREERKRASGKKGTIYEEEYLVNSIRRLVERANDINADVTNLVQGLLRRGMKERAANLDGAMADVIKACEVVLPEVWPSKKAPEDRDEVGERPMGGDGVLWDSVESASKETEPPVVKPSRRLALLGGDTVKG